MTEEKHEIMDLVRHLILTMLLFCRRIYYHVVHFVLSLMIPIFYPRSKLPQNDDPILHQPASVLAVWVREGKVTSAVVLSAFINRAKSISKINAVVDQRYNQALEEAKLVDKRLGELKKGELIDPIDDLIMPLPKTNFEITEKFHLLGIPFSCKENVKANGMKNTAGLYCRTGITAEYDADVVALYKNAGAILVSVTNIPELGLWYESSNVVYGTTRNPYDLARIPGGSTGGEAALMAAGGIPMSIGTDIGGSLRFPAYCCGTFSHKPTSLWVNLKGAGIFESKLIRPEILVAGPLARYTDDLTLQLEIMAPIHTKGLRSRIDDVSISNLTVWWAVDLGPTVMFSPVDSKIVKMIHKVKDFLKSKGATVKELKIDTTSTYKYWCNKKADDYPDEPPMIADMTDRKGEANLCLEWLRWCAFQSHHTVPVLGLATTEIFKKYPKPDPEQSEYYWKNLQTKFMDKLGNKGILLMPTLPVIAPFHNEPLFNTFDFCFSAIFNAIAFPVTQVPMGLTEERVPIGLQVATTPGNDHLSLAVSKVLEAEFGGWNQSLLSKNNS